MKVCAPTGLFVLFSFFCSRFGAAAAEQPVPYPVAFVPGSVAEQPYLLKIKGATAAAGTRHAERGQFWVYGFPVAPGAACRLKLTSGDTAAGVPAVSVTGLQEKPIAARASRDPDGALSVVWKAPDSWKLGERIPVTISARTAPVSITLVRFVQVEPYRDGLPESVTTMMTRGLAKTARPNVVALSSRPYTVTQTPRGPDPSIDLLTDALFAYTQDPTLIAAWKARGCVVWTMNGARDGKEYAAAHPDEVQTTADGKPLAIDDSHYFSPTENRLALERAVFKTALEGGSEGICPEEPEYWARAGYEGAFKQAWQKLLGRTWQDPALNVDSRWQAGQLMAQLEANHVGALLQSTQQSHPTARRMVALHSPISYAQWRIVCPHARIVSLPAVQDVVGQVWAGTARTPIRYAGVRQERTFPLAYLEYSSLAHLLRGTGKRLWFLVDPLEDSPNLPLADYRRRYEETVTAALLFPEVASYEVMSGPERVFARIPADYATEVIGVTAALQQMSLHSRQGAATVGDGIGILLSDSMQWQREPPAASDFDGVAGLTLPLLQRGVPVQVLSLDRAADPAYLNPFKTLLLSYDFQKPPDARTHAALAEWVRAGGCLIFVGGSDAYNAVASAWWRLARLDSPQAHLWSQLGISTGPAVTRAEPPEDVRSFKTALVGDGAIHDLSNRRAYTLDLTPYVQATGGVAVRFADVTPQDGWGVFLASAELKIGGQTAAAFQAGSEIESRFLVRDNGSQVNAQGRFADGDNSWTYQFDNLPRNMPVQLVLDMGNGFEVQVASGRPDTGQTLLAVPEASPLGGIFERMRLAAYPATVYPQIAPTGGAAAPGKPAALYTLRSGGAAVWLAEAGRGLVLNVGAAPGFFSSSERAAALLRALVQFGQQRVGGAYREQNAFVLRRGPFVIVRTQGVAETIEGRTVDLFSASLTVGKDRAVPPRSVALLYDLGPASGAPRVGFVAGRVRARLETPDATVFFACAPSGTGGAARLHSGGRALAGIAALDRLGRSLPIQALPAGDTVLLKYPNHPDGVVVRAFWKEAGTQARRSPAVRRGRAALRAARGGVRQRQ